MRRKSFESLQCPIGRSLERVGEWWSILILRDAFLGATRFEQFQKNLDIAPNMLTKRLTALVKSGLFERRQYSDRPKRYEYLLTERGRDFRPVPVVAACLGQQALRARGTQRRHHRCGDRSGGRPGSGRPGQRPYADRTVVPFGPGPGCR